MAYSAFAADVVPGGPRVAGIIGGGLLGENRVEAVVVAVGGRIHDCPPLLCPPPQDRSSTGQMPRTRGPAVLTAAASRARTGSIRRVGSERTPQPSGSP